MTHKNLLISIVIYLVNLILPTPIQAQTYLNKDDPAPYDGVLLETKEAAQLAAEMIGIRLKLQLCESSLTTCQDNAIKSIDDAIDTCEAHTRHLEDMVVSAPTEVEVIPWWIWVGVGAAFGVGFGIGMAL